ncbi:MAG: hypothetical protein R2880_00315 [Deinococcales bacterium]
MIKYLFIILLGLFSLGLAQELPEKGDGLTQVDRAIYFEVLQWPAYFEEIFKRTHVQNPLDDGYIEVFPLGEDKLIQVQSYSGSYQPGMFFIYYAPRHRDIIYLALPQLNQTERGFQVSAALEVAGLSDFDAETGELRIFSRSRGMGGCGHLAIYRFSYGAAWLKAWRAQSCEVADAQGEEMILSPDEWPLIWQE